MIRSMSTVSLLRSSAARLQPSVRHSTFALMRHHSNIQSLIPRCSSASLLPKAPAPLLVTRCFATSFLPKAEVTDRVLKVVKNFQNVDASKVSLTSHFQNDLGLDSLDTVELVMAFEDEFAVEIPDAEADKILTVSGAIDYIASHPQVK